MSDQSKFPEIGDLIEISEENKLPTEYKVIGIKPFVYENETGFALNYGDQITFNTWLAEAAHARGLAAFLKNDGNQVKDLMAHFDGALAEGCFAENECAAFIPFIETGKPVLAAEYTDQDILTEEGCAQAAALKFDVIFKNRELDAHRFVCP